MNDPVILFDGVCNFCNRSINFVIRRDGGKRFRFAPIQSETGRNLLKNAGLDPDSLDSVVLIMNEKVYQKSTAALTVSRHLSGLWPALYAFIVVPRPVRDWVYDLIARNRYSWWGRMEQCMIPTQDVKDRFLSG